MPSGAITIHGGTGTDTISFAFTVTGTHTLDYSNKFASAVNAILGTNPTTPVNPLAFGPAVGAVPAASDPVYVLQPDSVNGAPSIVYSVATDPTGYVVDTIGGALTLSTGAGDSVLVAAVNAATTVLGNGGGNQVIFVDGNNTYTAGSSDSGNDTIVAGSGFDTITTAAQGSTTVNSGTGDATINLADTTQGGFNDNVWLDDGNSTVYADGQGDAVVATEAGQTIIGGTSSSALLGVALLPDNNGAANGNDFVSAGAGTTTVYDYSSNNSIVGGSGNLYFLAGSDITATVDGGSGNIFGFAGSGDSINIVGADTGTVYFAAGGGNETLDGAGSSAQEYLYGGGDSTSTQVITGGNGHDVITAGAGTESLTGGTGANTYQLVDSVTAGGSITITDFTAGSNNTLILDGFSASDVQALLSGGTETSDGNYVVSLSNSLTVTFDNTTSSALLGHIITF